MNGVEASTDMRSSVGPGLRLARSGRRRAVVLAGGSGIRMREEILRRFGEERPKQYCAFVGTRTMLEHTWDRARRIVGANNVLTLASEGHQRWLPNEDSRPGEIVFQPYDRGTAAAVYLALARILARDPLATALVLPSDHYIRPERVFNDLARRACDFVETYPDRVLLMGAAADGPDPDYGWISPKRRSPTFRRSDEPSPREVDRFHEKPDGGTANRLHERGAMISTMIVAAKAATLWEIASEVLPELIERMDMVRRMMASAVHGCVRDEHVRIGIAHAYRCLPPFDLSRDLLQRVAGRCVALPMEGLEWNDWGRPERLLATLERGAVPSPSRSEEEEVAS